MDTDPSTIPADAHANAPHGIGPTVGAHPSRSLTTGGWIAALFLLGFLGLNGYLFVSAQAAASARDQAKKTLDVKLQQLTNPEAKAAIDEGTALQNQINAYVTALDSRLLWSKLLGHLQQATYTRARYNNISVNKDGTIRIDGETDTFSNVAKAFVALRDYTIKTGANPQQSEAPGFSDVKLSSVAVTPPSKEGESVKTTFSISLNVSLELLADPKAEKPPTATPPTGGSAGGSKATPPAGSAGQRSTPTPAASPTKGAAR